MLVDGLDVLDDAWSATEPTGQGRPSEALSSATPFPLRTCLSQAMHILPSMVNCTSIH